MGIDLEKLKEVSQPLMDYLRDNFHPHVTAIVDSAHTEIVEGLATIQNTKD